MTISRSVTSRLILILSLLASFLVVGGVELEWSQNRYYPFYHWQAEAFSRGQAHLPVPSDFYHDVIPFEDKKYLALPPLNGLILLPMISLGAGEVSERLVFFVFFVAYLFLFRSWLKREKPELTTLDEALWMFFFSLGTPLIISAGRGTAWFSATLTGSFFLALGLYLFHYSRVEVIRVLGLFSIVIASFSRTHFALLIPVLTLALLRIPNTSLSSLTWLSPKNLVLRWRVFIPGMIFTVLFLSWNYWRFGSYFDLHYKEHGYGAHFQELIETYGMTSIHYVWMHVYHGLISLPMFSSSIPFLKFDPNGNGVLAMSPLFLYMIFRPARANRESLSALGMLLLLMIPVFTHFSTGWSQHGYRYALDFLPFFFFLLVRSNFSIHSPVSIFLVLWSIWMNVTASLTLTL